jgi:fructan beta-fructosidase
VVDGTIEKTATGSDSERMTEVVWNVAAHAGKPARIRLVDASSGPWGRLNVDEFWGHAP